MYVVDPATWPEWVASRYEACGIALVTCSFEDMGPYASPRFDEAWIYNVLQHVNDPALVITNARAVAHKIRVFDWIEVDPYPGHPHRLEKKQLDDWLGAPGFVAQINENGAVGRAYYGVFQGADHQST